MKPTEIVLEQLSFLDKRRQWIVWWKLVDQKSFEEIADILKVSRQYIHKEYHSAIEQIEHAIDTSSATVSQPVVHPELVF